MAISPTDRLVERLMSLEEPERRVSVNALVRGMTTIYSSAFGFGTSDAEVTAEVLGDVDDDNDDYPTPEQLNRLEAILDEPEDGDDDPEAVSDTFAWSLHQLDELLESELDEAACRTVAEAVETLRERLIDAGRSAASLDDLVEDLEEPEMSDEADPFDDGENDDEDETEEGLHDR